MENPLLTQAAALLTSVVRRHVTLPCSLEQLEATIHPLAHALARQSAEQLAAESVTQAEQQPLSCACGGQPQAQQRRPRQVLLLFGRVTLRLRRSRGAVCRRWQCPGEAILPLRPRQRLTRTVEEWLGRFGLAWSYAVGAREVGRLLPGVAVSAKTGERCVARCGEAVAAREEAAASAAAQDERAVARTGLTPAGAEWFVFGDGASGMRSLWEQYLPGGRLVLDRWHRWEKLKERSREVFGRGPQALAACKEAYALLKQGAVDRAQALVAAWPARSERAEKQRARLLGYLERNADLIPDYEQLAAAGCLVGAGRSEKANDLVVVPRMKNGKMHWGRPGANFVALLRAYHLSDPDAPFLPM